MKRSPLAILFLSFLCTACMSDAVPLYSGITLSSADGDTVHLRVAVATTQEEQTHGLMEQTSMPGDGMLFVFDTADERNFWMKDTVMPLDILFFGEDGSFVSATSMDPCQADPCKLYPSGGPARYALEVRKDFVKEKGIGPGWSMTYD